MIKMGQLELGLLLATLLIFSLSAPAQAQNGCGDAPSPRLIVGQNGEVLFTDGSPLNIRDAGRTNGALVGQMDEGTPFEVIEGPVCADDIYWWHIQGSGVDGWAAEGVSGEYFVGPQMPDAATLDLSSQLPPDTVLIFRLENNDRVYTDLELNVLPEFVDAARRISPLAHGGSLRGFRRSPDGEWIAWLFDMTEVPPTMIEECVPENGCVGRVYELVMTNSESRNAQTIWEIIIDFPHPYLEMIGWQNDSTAVFFKRVPWGIAGPNYLPEGGGIYEVTIPDGSVSERSQDFLVADAVVSPDGRWLAESITPSYPYSVSVVSEDGIVYEYAHPDGTRMSQLTFSPDSDQLAWVQLNYADWPNSFDIASFDVLVMALADGAARRVATIVPDTPETTNFPFTDRWVSNNLLLMTIGDTSRLLDIATGQQYLWPPDILGQPAQFLGVTAALP